MSRLFVIGNLDGTTTDCAPFKCEGSVCKASCASVDDRVSGVVCEEAADGSLTRR